ncbi:RagB/SusD family nutrient uptake outer membrane protein [Salinimicrobium sp. WS361]|uniref:RagB/SusD family nutrient uptake outer membrane protein n=1 Tax=Salinimicrobium sp. WS361 TaxID=3425123 RepID=UPI003D6F7A49
MKCIKYLVLVIFCCSQVSCDDFVDIDTPDNLISSQEVFSRDETANNAVLGIYNELYRASFSSGFQGSITVLGDLSADNLEATFSNPNLLEYEENKIHPGNTANLELWSSAYNIIYMANSVIEGLNENNGVSPEVEDRLLGEAKVIRAFTYFYLVNLYGEIPLILGTDYRLNNRAARNDVTEVYDQIVEDLEAGIELLEPGYENAERLRVNKFTAMALLARVHLYVENWKEAEELSHRVITESQTYQLLNNLDDVFLANSNEAIWQISPLGGGTGASNTNEGELFIMLDYLESVKLTNDLVDVFPPGDLRFQNWIGSFPSDDMVYYFPYKYKIKFGTGDITEYSMVLRLAEQYLIRSEALARQGLIQEAIDDLNVIRERANLSPISDDTSVLTADDVLGLILVERRRELFAEWGHRWLDLKRFENAGAILKPLKPLWQETDSLYPIPENEIIKNPNLIQNPGY